MAPPRANTECSRQRNGLVRLNFQHSGLGQQSNIVIPHLHQQLLLGHRLLGEEISGHRNVLIDDGISGQSNRLRLLGQFVLGLSGEEDILDVELLFHVLANKVQAGGEGDRVGVLFICQVRVGYECEQVGNGHFFFLNAGVLHQHRRVDDHRVLGKDGLRSFLGSSVLRRLHRDLGGKDDVVGANHGGVGLLGAAQMLVGLDRFRDLDLSLFHVLRGDVLGDILHGLEEAGDVRSGCRAGPDGRIALFAVPVLLQFAGQDRLPGGEAVFAVGVALSLLLAAAQHGFGDIACLVMAMLLGFLLTAGQSGLLGIARLVMLMALGLLQGAGQGLLAGRPAGFIVGMLLLISTDQLGLFHASPAVFIVGMERFRRFRRESGGGQKAYAHRQDKKQGKAAFAQDLKNLHAINSSFLCDIVRMQRYPAAGLACRRH